MNDKPKPQQEPVGAGSGVEREVRHLVDLNKIMGRIELSSRWEPCGCGREYCGRFMNRKREIGRYGDVLCDVESAGVVARYEDCNGTKPIRWWQKLLNA